MNRVYDVLYKRGEHDGKGIWLKCGVVLKKPDGKMSLKLDVVPVGQFDGWLVVSERRQQGSNQSRPGVPEVGPGDDVPF